MQIRIRAQRLASDVAHLSAIAFARTHAALGVCVSRINGPLPDPSDEPSSVDA
jgi:hypothetical protein